jgi:hypothetical protein
MSLRLVCICGRRMALPEKYAGQYIQCPGCQAMLRIPTSEENLTLTRWVCSCGQRLKARSRTGGRKVRCPKCSSEVSVPFSEEHTAFVKENFMLNGESGIVQPVSDASDGDPQPPDDTGPPVVEPPVTNLLSAWPTEWDEKQTPAALKPGSRPPEPAHVLDDDEDVTRINPRGPTFLGEMAHTPAKGQTGDAYEVIMKPPAKPDRVRRQLVRPAEPAAETPQPAMPAQAGAEARAQGVEEEGIRSSDLLSRFSTKLGIEAAKTALIQARNGYRLYILYALLAACMVNIAQRILSAAAGHTFAAIAWLALPSLFSLFLWAGFVGCVKDGIFQRPMGIEGVFYNAGIHFLRFSLTSVTMAPIAIGLALAGSAAIETLWGPAPFIGRVGIAALASAVGMFALELLLMPPVVSVLEQRNAFSSLRRGFIFIFRHSRELVTITAASIILFWAMSGATCLFWWLSKLLFSSALPAWLFDSIKQFVVGLISVAFMGQVVASLTLLYLSRIGDKERVQDIQDRLRGPAAVPMRLYAAIGAAAVALLALSYFRVEQKPAAGDKFETAPAARERLPESAGPQAATRP